MSKYSKLKNYLLNISENRVALTFEEIENITGSKLPELVRIYRKLWRIGTHHAQTRNGWLAAGWQVISVDFDRDAVIFSRSRRLSHNLDSGDENTILRKGSTS